MKKTVAAVLCGVVLATAITGHARLIDAESRVVAVTVFSDRAMVKRVATVKLEKGENVVAFTGLPLQIVEDTLRAEGKGSAAARISGLSVRNVFPEDSSQAKVREIEAEIGSLERQVQRIDGRRSALAAQKAFIDSIRTGWGERISKELTLGKPVTAELNEASRFVGESVLKVEDGLVEAQAEKKPLLDRIAALKRQLADIGGSRGKEVRTAEVIVDASQAMTMNLELSYLINQARWEPVYDIRLAADGKSAELLYRASVAQNSGEDWQGVNLSLSTATPSAGSAPPELQPWNVHFPEVRPLAGHARKMSMVAAAPAPMARMAEATEPEFAADEAALAPLPATHQSSLVSARQTSVLFVVPKPVDVPADGSRQSSLIATEKIPVKAEFVAVPKMSEAVFLKSEVTNGTSYPLLAGTVNVFNDTAYVGKSYLKPVAPGEKFDLFFGSDEAVKVKRKAVRVKKDAGILAGNSVGWKCSVELENYRKEEISLSLFDQIPVAGNEEIKVVLKDAQPSADEVRPDGRTTWKLQLKPGEKRTISYQIDLEYPKGREIVGAE